MKDKLINGIKTWIKLWPDIWAVPLTLGGLWLSYFLLNWLDPTIGTFDMGILQALLFTVAVLVTLNAVAFLGIEFNDNNLWNYYKRKYEVTDKPNVDLTDEADFENLTSWQRTKLLYFWRAFLLSLGAAIFVSLI